MTAPVERASASVRPLAANLAGALAGLVIVLGVAWIHVAAQQLLFGVDILSAAFWDELRSAHERGGLHFTTVRSYAWPVAWLVAAAALVLLPVLVRRAARMLVLELQSRGAAAPSGGATAAPAPLRPPASLQPPQPPRAPPGVVARQPPPAVTLRQELRTSPAAAAPVRPRPDPGPGSQTADAKPPSVPPAHRSTVAPAPATPPAASNDADASEDAPEDDEAEIRARIEAFLEGNADFKTNPEFQAILARSPRDAWDIIEAMGDVEGSVEAEAKPERSTPAAAAAAGTAGMPDRQPSEPAAGARGPKPIDVADVDLGLPHRVSIAMAASRLSTLDCSTFKRVRLAGDEASANASRIADLVLIRGREVWAVVVFDRCGRFDAGEERLPTWRLQTVGPDERGGRVVSPFQRAAVLAERLAGELGAQLAREDLESMGALVVFVGSTEIVNPGPQHPLVRTAALDGRTAEATACGGAGLPDLAMALGPLAEGTVEAVELTSELQARELS